ncbi:MAG: hypothetical protein J3T61_09960 [Candidatus Brocadiales bacterium]|nr:hypothetical protein [Candidatus Bathyanammoxibius sp.]
MTNLPKAGQAGETARVWMECINTAIDKIRVLDLQNSKKAEIMDLLLHGKKGLIFPSPTKESRNE